MVNSALGEEEIKEIKEEFSQNDDEKIKLGIPLNLHCRHPLLDKNLPIYIANFVLDNYGEGAIFGCPAHDERDFEFAKKYSLPIKTVVKPKDVKGDFLVKDEAYIGDGILVNSSFLNGLKTPDDAISKAIEEIQIRKAGKKKINFRLKDWGISRQRYWGCPIPIAYDERGNFIPVPKEQLPVKLPENINLKTKGNPLDHQDDWKKITNKWKKI